MKYGRKKEQLKQNKKKTKARPDWRPQRAVNRIHRCGRTQKLLASHIGV
jgi:hypothetical protein